jgi:DNA-binding transcriptional regulator LsrR (DeoR family)
MTGKMAGQLQQLTELVDKLNDRFLSPTLDQMRDICRRGGVLAVCGGRHKISAIRHLLSIDQPVISHLVTDHSTATALIAD